MIKFEDYMPTTLEGAIHTIVDNLTEEERDFIKKNGTGCAHMTFGMAMRNGWGLWHGSQLAKHFGARFGLGHADDMSGLILSGVEAAVNGGQFDPDADASGYKEYWAKQDIDPLTQQAQTGAEVLGVPGWGRMHPRALLVRFFRAWRWPR